MEDLDASNGLSSSPPRPQTTDEGSQTIEMARHLCSKVAIYEPRMSSQVEHAIPSRTYTAQADTTAILQPALDAVATAGIELDSALGTDHHGLRGAHPSRASEMASSSLFGHFIPTTAAAYTTTRFGTGTAAADMEAGLSIADQVRFGFYTTLHHQRHLSRHTTRRHLSLSNMPGMMSIRPPTLTVLPNPTILHWTPMCAARPPTKRAINSFLVNLDKYSFIVGSVF